jgi:glycogen operon protein
VKLEVLPGRPFPLGATWDGEGTNFAVFSEHGEAVELCVFDEVGAEHRALLMERDAFVWHGWVRGLGPGTRYGYRVHGAWDPPSGRRFNPHKLLVDPYARALDGKVDHRAPLPGMARDGSRDRADSAWGVPKSVVVHDDFDWRGDCPPNVRWADMVIYEAHVGHLTKRHHHVAPELRGTYLGLTSSTLLDHLRSIGVTSIELLPVHEAATERGVWQRGKENVWGYSTLGYFAPDQRFASRPGRQVTEFKEMVRRLHEAGFEVLLDVVYNHTCEGGADGPTLFLRGLDDAVYYRLDEGGVYADFTGCGNTLNASHPQTLKLIMDSLRYWVTEMHVDGFRFDLAASLGRHHKATFGLATFFDIVHQDPVLSRVKLIAEPWDLGADGYQVGNFPVLWAEWNGRYRDTVRRFWRGDPGQVADLAYRITGSSDLFADDGRKPQASINFVTAHDGFTLRDLVSYEQKHNEDNGEDNRDGSNQNHSDNHGVEGETDDPAVKAARARSVRTFFATLFFSQGVPMIAQGDELGRTQRGNNNAYCQDGPIAWVDWQLDDERRELLDFVTKLATIRRAHPNFQRTRFFKGSRRPGSQLKDLTWLRADGREMTEADWHDPSLRTIALVLSGMHVGERTPQGQLVGDDCLALLLSAAKEPLPFVIPRGETDAPWEVVVDTAHGRVPAGGRVRAGEERLVLPRTLVLLRQGCPT